MMILAKRERNIESARKSSKIIRKQDGMEIDMAWNHFPEQMEECMEIDVAGNHFPEQVSNDLKKCIGKNCLLATASKKAVF